MNVKAAHFYCTSNCGLEFVFFFLLSVKQLLICVSTILYYKEELYSLLKTSRHQLEKGECDTYLGIKVLCLV